MRGWLVGLAMTCAAACTTAGDSDAGSNVDASAATSGRGGPLVGADADDDNDGVCNGTEMDRASDPNRADSDHDGLPDFTEIVAGYNETDPTVPGPDQVAFLSGAAQAVLDFDLRMTLEGSGQGYTGEFKPQPAADARGLTAKDFFQGAIALGGEPPDNVRGIQAESEHFSSVIGRTRLSFILHFRVMTDKVAGCTIGYPFEYRLKADNGTFSASRDYLLVVTPETNNGERAEFCVPSSCL